MWGILSGVKQITMKFSILMTVLLLSCGLARPAEACYSAREIEAEQALRIHSELMVIGLTCIKMPEGRRRYSEYQSFTQKNADLIANYEQDLIYYFKKQGALNPEKRLHTLRTNLANEVSRKAISMSTLHFCQTYGTNIDRAVMMNAQTVRRWAQHASTVQAVSERKCSL